MLPILAIVVPCYKEEAVLAETTRRLSVVLDELIAEKSINPSSKIVYVNDGSRDRTWPMISDFAATDSHVAGVNLSGNVGHQNALMAGLSVAAEHADLIVSIDADLQDDERAIIEMVHQAAEGKQIVLGVRAARTTDTFFKRTTAQGYYRLLEMMGVEIVYNHADYRLMSREATLHLLDHRERNLFLRGLVPHMGYEMGYVYYDRREREAGESKYPLSKMLSLAWDGVTSFSIKPIRMLLTIGFIFILVALGIAVWALYMNLTGGTVRGWTSLILSIWFCSGVNLMGVGIVGEYIGKIYTEVKDRPRYKIHEICWK